MRTGRVLGFLIGAGVVVFLGLALVSGVAWPWVQSKWAVLLAVVMANNPLVLLVLALVGLAVVFALFFRRRR